MEEQRSSGRTTRLVDKYIQEYFTKPLYTPIVIKDHVDKYENNFELLEKVLARLKFEFNETPYSDNNAVLFNSSFSNNTIGKQCIIVRTEDKILNTKKKRFQMYKNQVESLENQYEDSNEAVRRKPPIFDYLLVDRATGRTTRLVDYYVQKYFNLKPGEYIEITDHYEGGKHGMANDILAKRIAKRLEHEHNEKFYLHRGMTPRIVRVEK